MARRAELRSTSIFHESIASRHESWCEKASRINDPLLFCSIASNRRRLSHIWKYAKYQHTGQVIVLT